MQPHLRGIHGQLSDILAEGAAGDATAALEEEIRTLRGRLAASEELLRLRRRAGHFDARTEALIADIARASTPGPVNPLFLLLNPPQILKTRVRPKFWKICGWPI